MMCQCDFINGNKRTMACDVDSGGSHANVGTGVGLIGNLCTFCSLLL